MRWLRLALWPAGLLLGIAAEWGAWTDDPGGAAGDLAVGLLLNVAARVLVLSVTRGEGDGTR